MSQPKCKDCKWWELVRQLGCSSDLSSKEYNKDVGYCHVKAPVLVDGVKRWPEMVEDDWCGEFKAKKEKCNHVWVNGEQGIKYKIKVCSLCGERKPEKIIKDGQNNPQKIHTGFTNRQSAFME